ncbi:MAG TPA: cytochrome c [Devosia sp.]
MSLPRTAAALAAVTSAATFFAGAIAQNTADFASMSHEELVEMRQAAMKEDGGILRGAGNLSGADAGVAADTLIRNFTNFPAMFPEGSIVGDSRALPVIWENWDEFTGIFATAQQAATRMKVAAEAGDTAAYGAALQTIGGTCGQCHQNFRSR